MSLHLWALCPVKNWTSIPSIFDPRICLLLLHWSFLITHFPKAKLITPLKNSAPVCYASEPNMLEEEQKWSKGFEGNDFVSCCWGLCWGWVCRRGLRRWSLLRRWEWSHKFKPFVIIGRPSKDWCTRDHAKEEFLIVWLFFMFFFLITRSG
jgi:hypothetical protein